MARRIQDLVLRAGGEGMRSWRRYCELWQRIAGGELGEDAIREEYVRFARDENDRYLRTATSVSRAFYDALLELGRRYHPPFFERVFVPARPARTATEAPASSAGLAELLLCAALDDEARASFIVENRREERDEVSFVVSEFQGPAGPPFRPPLRLEPARFVLDSCQRREVRVTLPLLAACFTPGQRYLARITVRSHDGFELNVVAVASGAGRREPADASSRGQVAPS